jgi:hypothetical protein
MSISGILYAIATVIFLLAAFGASFGDDIAMIPLGLVFLAAGLAVSALNVGAAVRSDRRVRD